MAIPTRKEIVLAVVTGLSLIGTPAWADDAEDCRDAEALIEKEPARVVAACTRLAESGDVEAQVALIWMYRLGKGVPKDERKVVTWVRRVEPQGVCHGLCEFDKAHDAQQAGDHAAAIRGYTRALRLGMPRRTPELEREYMAIAHTNRGVAYNALGNVSRAIEDHQRALEIDPTYGQAKKNLASAINNRGIQKLMAKDTKGAIEDFSSAIDLTSAVSLTPDDAQFFANRCFAYALEGRKDEARSDCKVALRLNPDSDAKFVMQKFELGD